tara:strand:- start:2967 stop:3167 length:201 start_codon:yes stop_codon:yes gene_type:complete
MGIVIKSISNLPYKEQEECLDQLTSALSQNLKPIEIDGKIYHIPPEVQTLIDSLWDLVEKPKDKIY